MAAKKKTSGARKRKNTEKVSAKGLLITLLSIVVLLGAYYLIDPAGFDARIESMFGASPAVSTHTASPDETLAPSASPAASATDSAIASAVPSESGKTLDVYVIDVGQGDSIFLRSPNGSTMLIDASENKAYDAIDAFLKAMDVHTLDVVVATHPHSDHIGGMTKVIRNYDIGAFYLPDKTHTTSTYEKMIAALEERNVKVYPAIAGADSFIKWDSDVEVRILSPFANTEYDDLNDWSVMLRVKYGDTAMLLTGDAEMYAEGVALSKLDASYFKADVLKIGHHGSSSSTSPAFFEAVDPSVAVMSLGEGNDYGHPHKETLELINDSGIDCYRTDISGTVHIVLDGTNVCVSTEK